MAVVWIVDMAERGFENAGKLKYLRTTAVHETACRRRLRAGQVRSGQVRRMLAASRLVLCCPFLSL
jgi:hypothetical protein